MSKVLSKDGTPIVFDRSGQGPALIMVNGATATRAATGESSASLSPDFTVFSYDRRGRGDSPAFMHHGAEELTKILPNAQHRRLAGQDHGVAGDVLMPVLVEFFIG